MIPVRLGFRAFDPHELLCHFVAEASGAYEAGSLRPHLVDLTFLPQVPPDVFEVACGSALLAHLQGRKRHIVLEAARGPLFWLFGAGDGADASATLGGTVASYPLGSPPDVLLRLFLRVEGVDPDSAVTFVPIRDDAARLGLLRAGEVTAALVSSAVPPPRVRHSGFSRLGCLADRLTVPTSGLAVDPGMFTRQKDVVLSVALAHRHSLAVIQNEPEVVASVLREIFGHTDAEAEEMVGVYQATMSPDGIVGIETVPPDARLVAHEVTDGRQPDLAALYGGL